MLLHGDATPPLVPRWDQLTPGQQKALDAVCSGDWVVVGTQSHPGSEVHHVSARKLEAMGLVTLREHRYRRYSSSSANWFSAQKTQAGEDVWLEGPHDA